MGTFIRCYDIDKRESFELVAKNCLEQLSLINNKCNEWKTTYSDISEHSDFCDKVICYYKKITEIVDNSISSITDTYTYAAMYNNDAYIKLRDLNLKLEMINLELKPLMGICKPECNFYNTNFADFITPDKDLINQIVCKRMDYYFSGDNWKELLAKNADEISDQEYIVLAQMYSQMSYNECGEFLQYFYIRTANVEEEKRRWDKFVTVVNVGHSEFSLEKDKIEKFQIALGLLQEQSYDSFLKDKKIDYSNINVSESYKQYSNLIQKNAILNSLLKHDKLFNVKDADTPFINISNPSDNRYKYLTISYYTFKKCIYGDPHTKPDDGKLITKTITLSDVLTKQNDDYSAKISQEYNRVGRKFFNIGTDDIIKKNMQDYITSTAISKTTDALSEEITKSTAKSVLTNVGAKALPVIGDLAMTFAQIDEDREKRKAEITHFYEMSSLINQSFINSRMDLYGVAILNEDDNICSFYVQPGLNTEAEIEEFNSKNGQDCGTLTLENVLKGDNKVYESLIKANSKVDK